jgi:hypothetical protein
LFIPDPGSRGQKGTGSRFQDPGSESATLIVCFAESPDPPFFRWGTEQPILGREKFSRVLLEDFIASIFFYFYFLGLGEAKQLILLNRKSKFFNIKTVKDMYLNSDGS